MPASQTHKRAYMQSRLREEIARARRYGTPFAIAVFETVASDGLPLRKKMEYALSMIAGAVRTSDVVALAFEDTIVVLLVQTDATAVKDALLRVRNSVSRQAGGWQMTTYVFPRDEAAIEALPLFTAA